ncbi:hypothetical protein M514_07569 [Trichuris suis]|uniref:Uncharacterized protein n=1 Tax=Trichuris suis TaxID=68888 RepID=A0A085NCK7_9BILA|nr:hypothetical protein M514_07569 [Trichuris suis]
MSNMLKHELVVKYDLKRVIHGTSLKLADYHDLKSLENSDGGKRFGDVTECQKRTSRASARKELPYGMF